MQRLWKETSVLAKYPHFPGMDMYGLGSGEFPWQPREGFETLYTNVQEPEKLSIPPSRNHHHPGEHHLL